MFKLTYFFQSEQNQSTNSRPNSHERPPDLNRPDTSPVRKEPTSPAATNNGDKEVITTKERQARSPGVRVNRNSKNYKNQIASMEDSVAPGGGQLNVTMSIQVWWSLVSVVYQKHIRRVTLIIKEASIFEAKFGRPNNLMI